MNTTDIKTLFEYNAWANDRTRRAVESLPQEQLYVDLKNSFGSLHATVLHLCGAEDIWHQRLTGADPGIFMKKDQYQTYEEVKTKWLEVENEWNSYLSTLNDTKLAATIIFHNLKGEEVSNVVWHALQHLVNHSTYHRGQITTMIRQSGGVPIGTDLIAFYRQKTE